MLKHAVSNTPYDTSKVTDETNEKFKVEFMSMLHAITHEFIQLSTVIFI